MSITLVQATPSYVTMPQSAAVQPVKSISMSLWVKRHGAAATDFQAFFQLHDDNIGDVSYALYLRPTPQVRMEVNGGALVHLDTGAYPADETWVFFAFSLEYSVFQKLYENAVLKDSAPVDAVDIDYDGTHGLSLGGGGIEETPNADIADMRIYNRSLSFGEIKEIYNSFGQDTVLNGLIYRALCNELSAGTVVAAGASVKDCSVTRLDGTQAGNPVYAFAPFKTKRRAI